MAVRVIRGKVVDRASAPVAGARVYSCPAPSVFPISRPSPTNGDVSS